MYDRRGIMNKCCILLYSTGPNSGADFERIPFDNSQHTIYYTRAITIFLKIWGFYICVVYVKVDGSTSV